MNDNLNNEKGTNDFGKKSHHEKYKIKVDDDIFKFDNPIITGQDILIKADKLPIECYSLYQKFEGCDFNKISLDEKVDLSKPGIEKFVIKPSEVSNYTVDGEPEMTDRKYLTANEILALAGLNSNEYYLVMINPDNNQIPYLNNPDEPIEMKCTGLKFISVYKSVTPVA